uniref:Putative salivary odorant binding protein n=1 Tax=Culex tarsalis TaxID=7177 RepID=A0A1Q3EUY8_CULTA
MVSVVSIAVVLALAVVSASSDGAVADSKQQYLKNKELCGKLLQVPAEAMEQYQRFEYPENHETFCYIRCIGILQGHFEDEQGLQVDKLFALSNMGKSKEEFTELVNGCQAQVGEDVSCYCHKAYIPLMCFWKEFREWKKTAGSGEEAA